MRLHEKTWTHDGRPHLDKAAPGPWFDEPDKVQWVDAATDLDCLAVRNRMGAWCGYVGLPSSHPDYGKEYGEVELEVDVHGSLTFAGPCHEEAPEGFGVCHIPLDGRPDDVWWFGFDTAHACDMIPNLGIPSLGVEFGPMLSSPYRTLDYVQEETSILAMQLALNAVKR